MNVAHYMPPADRTRRILEDLEAVRENLLALSDDIWLTIDRQDLAAFDDGVRFMRTYIERMASFDDLASEISAMVQGYTSVRLESDEQTGVDNREQNERLIRELDRDQPHTIDEDFTFRRPHGFILDGQAATGITTWRRLYELFCQQLYRRDPQRRRGLPQNPNFITSRGNCMFSTQSESLRAAFAVADDLFVECHYSANGLRDMMRELLAEFAIPKESLLVYMRQDRDAERRRE